MSYSIETRTVTEFVTDNTVRLPRFQRKSTWKSGQNFELAISMFKEYPLGVIVINDERGTSWLLDGRQRRNALKELRNNPDKVYDSAKSYIKFKSNESEDILKEKFWQKVDSYLVTYAAMSNEERKSIGEENTDSEEDLYEDGINRERQQAGLNVLLDIILMVHQKKKYKQSDIKYGKWERLFKLDEYLFNLPYAPKKDNYRIDPERLHAFLLKIGDDSKKEDKELSAEYFMEVMDENIKEDKRQEFELYLSKNWADMSKVIDVIARSEQIFRQARIGVISIKNVTPLDAQNIFSKINSGGTPLTPEELISAKPFWNEKVNKYDHTVQALVKNLYDKLGVTALADGSVVRWDLAATLMGRIKDSQLFFEDYKTKNDIDKGEISNGFRLLAAWFMKGISKVHVTGLEQNKEIEWPNSIDAFVEDFNLMCKALNNDEFFRILRLWKRPFIKLLGESVTFEFCAIMLQDWKDLGEPMVSGTNLNTFLRHSRALFDNIVFENASGYWKGSGDSKMGKHLKQYKTRLVPLENEVWGDFLKEICTKGAYNGQSVSKSNIEPLIYYQVVIRKKLPSFDSDRQYEIDHIIPQSKLKNNKSVPDWFMDSVANLSLLPAEENKKKRALSLSEIKGSVLAHEISELAGIEEHDFDKYSDVSGINDLIEVRENLWLDTFLKKRLNELNK